MSQTPIILQAELDAFVDARGYYAGAIMPDGRVAMLVPRLFGVDVVVGAEPTEMAGVLELYTFAPARVGILAWFNWVRAGLEGEPEGWIRHRPSDRRRYPDGDPATERVEK